MQLWFKYDLRTDDHPGMVAVADSAAELVPLFCFDPKQYVQVLRAPGGPEALWGALKGLQDSLRQINPPLPPLPSSLASFVFPADALFAAIRYQIRSSDAQALKTAPLSIKSSAAAGSRAAISSSVWGSGSRRSLGWRPRPEPRSWWQRRKWSTGDCRSSSVKG